MDTRNGRGKPLSRAEIDRLFDEADQQIAFEAQMRGVPLAGMRGGRLETVYPDGSRSPIPAPLGRGFSLLVCRRGSLSEFAYVAPALA